MDDKELADKVVALGVGGVIEESDWINEKGDYTIAGNSGSAKWFVREWRVAGALMEIGLPAQAVPLALLFFNVGVELGQLLFIAAVGLVIALARLASLPQPVWAWRVPAYGIGSLATYWMIERVVGFWS